MLFLSCRICNNYYLYITNEIAKHTYHAVFATKLPVYGVILSPVT